MSAGGWSRRWGGAAWWALTRHVPPGGLSLAVEGPSKAEISCTDNQDGTCSVSYLPVLPGDYSIAVKYNEKHIAGSPFTARITGTGTWGGTRGARGAPGRGLGGHCGLGGHAEGAWGSLRALGEVQRGPGGVGGTPRGGLGVTGGFGGGPEGPWGG